MFSRRSFRRSRVNSMRCAERDERSKCPQRRLRRSKPKLFSRRHARLQVLCLLRSALGPSHAYNSLFQREARRCTRIRLDSTRGFMPQASSAVIGRHAVRGEVPRDAVVSAPPLRKRGDDDMASGPWPLMLFRSHLTQIESAVTNSQVSL
jgi:hypothetical protein